MSDRMRLTGMFSGMDTESIVQQLVAVRQTKVDNLKNDQKKLEWKQTAWQDLNSKIYNLYSSTLSNMRLTGTYKKKTTTSSDATKATVIADSNTPDGTHTLSVKQLAKAGYLTGAKLASGSEPYTAATTLGKMGMGDGEQKIVVKTGKDANLKETEIVLNKDMKLSEVVSKLKDAGLSASFDEANQRFFISSKDTGADNDFTIEDVSGSSALSVLGLSSDKATKIAGQDAQIMLNGVEYTSAKNTFTVNGLTITAMGVTDGEINITTATDYKGAYDTIKEFLSEYNDVINEIDKLYNADSARKYKMLSSDQKDSMSDEEVEKWEGTIKGALLRKDTNLRTIMDVMVMSMNETFDMGGTKKHLSDYGINTLSYNLAKDNEHHAYHINGDKDDSTVSAQEDKLMKALVADPDGTIQFFADLSKNLYDKIGKIMNETNDYSSVYKVYNDKQLKKDYDSYTKKIKEAEDKLSAYEDKWYNKFAQMEKAMAKMQNNQSAVSGMLGTK